MKRILVIDDEESILALIKSMISGYDYEVDAISDSRVALDMIKKNNYTLVITDLIMPNVEGVEIIVEIRKLYPQLKIIAISAGGRVSPESYLHNAKLLGANNVLQKPFSKKALVGAIHELVDEY